MLARLGRLSACAAVAGILAPAEPLSADAVTFRQQGKARTVHGTVLAQFHDGSLLVEGTDTRHWVIEAGDLVEWKDKGKPAPSLSKAQLRNQLQGEFGRNFHVHETNHYMIVFDCDTRLAQQAGTLLERAYNVFRAHFASKGAFRFENLKQPLIAVLFKTRKEYLEATKNEVGVALAWSAGMYSPLTNRFYMYDAFEGNLARQTTIPLNASTGATRQGSPADPRNVELVIHEGTHQLAFNFGLHHRHANNPVWLVEGLATYFEAADESASEGWRRAGEINPYRLAEFARMLPTLKPGFLDELITNDRIYSEGNVGEAYAQGWALTYYLMRVKQTSYIRYLRAVQARGLAAYPAEDRLADFKSAFGTTPRKMEDDFRRYMAGLLAAETKASAAQAPTAK